MTNTTTHVQQLNTLLFSTTNNIKDNTTTGKNT